MNRNRFKSEIQREEESKQSLKDGLASIGIMLVFAGLYFLALYLRSL